MRILLVGNLGQLGRDLERVLAGQEVTGVDREQVDVCDEAQVEAAVDAARPETIINCSAFHRVDECEDVPEAAFAVNVFGVRNLAMAARRAGAALVHFSTDYVFGGPERRAHPESDMPCPQSVYAVSKLSGEFMLRSIWPRHFVVRTCGLYGYAGSREKGTNFVESMLKLGASGKPLRVIDDQLCTPTSTMELARAVCRLIATDRYGLYHLTAEGECSWHEFACAIFELAGMRVEVARVSSAEFAAKAPRPPYSVLDNRNWREAGFAPMLHWKAALAEYLRGRR
jgi:dTDP-4-dehydrorhamnose reductase